MSWAFLHQLGNLTLTLPLAVAVAAGLLAARSWRPALYWLLMFATALSVVGASKIAFLGWGTAIPALDFKAFSGHAAGVAAVYPVLLGLVLRRFEPELALLGALLGLALGGIVAMALIQAGEHTAAEACAGWLVGAAASMATLHLTRGAALPRPLPGLASFLVAFAATSAAMQQAQVGYWMVKVALALSGNDFPFRWDSCG